MKRAVILHGTDANPETNWFPWLKQKFEAAGYEVWVPLLPENHTPNRHTYNDFLFGSGWDFTDNIVVGHSSGAVSVLNMLMDERCPHIRMGVMVSAWEHGTPATMEDYQFRIFSRRRGLTMPAYARTRMSWPSYTGITTGIARWSRQSTWPRNSGHLL